MHHGRTWVCIYVGHMVVSTVLGPPWSEEGLAETCGGRLSPLGRPPPSARESSWVFNEISGPSVPRPTPSSSSTMDKASQPAHCPYVLHGGRYRSLPLSRVFDVCTVLCALAAQTHLHPHCVTVIENIGFLVTIQSHLKPSMLTYVSRMSSIFDTSSSIFYSTMYRKFKK